MAKILPPTAAYPWASTDVQASTVMQLTKNLIAAKVKYGFGYKAKSLDQDSHDFWGVKDGKLARKVDCSGYVRYVMAKNGILIPDGSWGENDWAVQTGLKECSLADVGNKDGRLRLGYLPPSQASDNIGHIFFVLNGCLIESHGSVGVDVSRKWGSKPWHGLCRVYVLNPLAS